ncbi:NAD(P)H nitroreductase [Mycobacterium parmense]|nr:NAD(P)H nitroreductase [Mycobacterium parmense]
MTRECGTASTHAGPDIEVIRQAVLLAGRAPSVHNSQPWRWVTEDGKLRLFVDRRRAVPGADPSGRETILSCGVVLDHVRVAMLAAGWQARIRRFPDPLDPDNLATIEFAPAAMVSRNDRDRAGAILQRRTDRLPLGRPTYWHLLEPGLRGACDQNLVMLDVLPDEARPRLAKVSRLTEVLRRDDATYRAELDWWTSPFALAEGVPPSALLSERESRRVDIGRAFPARGHGDRRPEVAADWSKILVLSTPDDTRVDVLRCGEALSAVLLECTTASVATCTLTHLIEIEESRDIVRGLLDKRGRPQVLIRAGIAPPAEHLAAPTPRRPLDDVLKVHL